MSFGIELVADSTGKWYPNGIRLATEAEAQAYGQYKFDTWWQATDMRVVAVEGPANYTFTDQGLVHIETEEAK